MFASFGQAFVQFFTMITTLFSAGNRTANALNHLAGVAEDTAAQYSDEARIKRQKQAAELEESLRQTQVAIAAAKQTQA
jgi:CBS domain containing-hemolysin-like protein